MKKLYEDYCVAFIDILGFKEMTSNKERIGQYAQSLTESIELMKSVPLTSQSFGQLEKDDIIIIQGADSLFIIFPKEFFIAYNMIRRIMILQLVLAVKGIYIRGSINSGAMYLDTENEIYFGEAWNKAVFEESIAIYPRILLENSIADLIEKGLRRMNESVGEFYLDNDGVYVLDSYGMWPEFDLKGIFEEPLTRLLSQLDVNTLIHDQNRKVLQKYLWVANSIMTRKQYGKVFELAKEAIDNITSNLTKL